MEPTPDTVNYMIGGYIVFTVVMVLYVISLFMRWNSLKNDEQTLKALEK